MSRTPQECYGVSDHWPLDCLFNSLFLLSITKTSKLSMPCTYLCRYCTLTWVASLVGTATGWPIDHWQLTLSQYKYIVLRAWYFRNWYHSAKITTSAYHGTYVSAISSMLLLNDGYDIYSIHSVLRFPFILIQCYILQNLNQALSKYNVCCKVYTYDINSVLIHWNLFTH